MNLLKKKFYNICTGQASRGNNELEIPASSCALSFCLFRQTRNLNLNFILKFFSYLFLKEGLGSLLKRGYHDTHHDDIQYNATQNSNEKIEHQSNSMLSFVTLIVTDSGIDIS